MEKHNLVLSVLIHVIEEAGRTLRFIEHCVILLYTVLQHDLDRLAVIAYYML